MDDGDETQKEITKAPSELDLIVALFRNKATKFIIDGKEVKIHVMSLEREDGSCKSWNFKGLISSKTDNLKEYADMYCVGWFAYEPNRKGWIKINDQE